MKLKSLLFVICFGLFSQSFAANVHTNPNAKDTDNNKQSSVKSMMYPGYCQIEIMNNSYDNLSVFGTFDDNSSIGFDINRFEAPHYISLFYYGYCHDNMYISIRSYQTGYIVYSGYTKVHTTINIIPFKAQGLNGAQSLKAEVTSK